MRLILTDITGDTDKLFKVVKSNQSGILDCRLLNNLVKDSAQKRGLDLHNSFWYSNRLIQPDTNELFLNHPVGLPKDFPIIDSLIEYGKQVKRSEHFLSALNCAKKSFAKIFDNLDRFIMYHIELNDSYDTNAEHKLHQDLHTFIFNVDFLCDPLSLSDRSLKLWDDNSRKTHPGYIVDIAFAAHEYGHAIFEAMNPWPGISTPDYYNTIDSCFNEGFAMLVESEVLYDIHANSSSQEERVHIQNYFKDRLPSLDITRFNGLEFFRKNYRSLGNEGLESAILGINRVLTMSKKIDSSKE